MTNYKCIFCDYKSKEKNDLYKHIEEEHEHQIPKNMTVAQLYFNYKNKYLLEKNNGTCVICGEPTLWCESAERYERFCNNPNHRCREIYRENFIKNMVKTYGKEHLLDDVEQQKKMLANRKISGEYIWSNGTYKTLYTGSYEKDFLEFMDHVLGWSNPQDIMMPAPQIFNYQTKDGTRHFYLVDVFISSLNLLIEIKASDNKHYRERDIEVEKIKDKTLENSEFNFIKVYDKDYSGFFNWLIKFREDNLKNLK